MKTRTIDEIMEQEFRIKPSDTNAEITVECIGKFPHFTDIGYDELKSKLTRIRNEAVVEERERIIKIIVELKGRANRSHQECDLLDYAITKILTAAEQLEKEK